MDIKGNGTIYIKKGRDLNKNGILLLKIWFIYLFSL